MPATSWARRCRCCRSSTGCGYASFPRIPGATRSSGCCAARRPPTAARTCRPALAEELLALVTEQWAVRPTILVVDDLQWADPATITEWGRLARSARQVPLLLIGMMRSVPQRDDLLGLRQVAGDAARLQLTGAAVTDLVAALAGGRQPALAHRAFRRAGPQLQSYRHRDGRRRAGERFRARLPVRGHSGPPRRRPFDGDLGRDGEAPGLHDSPQSLSVEHPAGHIGQRIVSPERPITPFYMALGLPDFRKPYRRAVTSWLARMWREHRMSVIVVCVLAAAGLAVAFIWPFTDLIAAHDVGRIAGSQRALQLQAAREAVRTQLLTLAAGSLAAGALVFTAWNVTLYRSNLTLYRRTNEITEQGQVTDRYNRAVEQLGSDKLDVRIGGIYALERVARDSPRDHPTVMEVLTAFVREHSHEQWQTTPNEGGDTGPRERATRPDVQAAMRVIARRRTEHDEGQIDLTNVNLTGADLRKASLARAILTGADLTRVNFHDANLTGADLTGATLAGADLARAELAPANLSPSPASREDVTNALLAMEPRPLRFPPEAASSAARLEPSAIEEHRQAERNWARAQPLRDHLVRTSLEGADFTGANLAVADLRGAKLEGAILTGANLYNADLTGAELAKADLTRAKLEWADLTRAGLGSAKLAGAKLAHANLTRARLAGATLGPVELSDEPFRGILTATDLTEANLSHAFLWRADLTSALLQHAILTGANLGRTNLTNARLNSADLTDVSLEGADLTGADLNGARFSEDAPVPQGWVREPGTGGLRRASDGGESRNLKFSFFDLKTRVGDRHIGRPEAGGRNERGGRYGEPEPGPGPGQRTGGRAGHLAAA